MEAFIKSTAPNNNRAEGGDSLSGKDGGGIQIKPDIHLYMCNSAHDGASSVLCVQRLRKGGGVKRGVDVMSACPAELGGGANTDVIKLGGASCERLKIERMVQDTSQVTRLGRLPGRERAVEHLDGTHTHTAQASRCSCPPPSWRSLSSSTMC